MPYQLFFHARRESVPSEESLAAYLLENPRFSVEPWHEETYGTRFFYSNGETGVECSFLYEPDCGEVADYTPDGYIYPGLYFRMNLRRPVFYALEVMPMVAAFCRHFDLLVDDPQEETVAPADEKELIRAWMRFNLREQEEMEPQEAVAFAVVPMEKVIRWWRYTYHISAITDIPAPYLLWLRDDHGRAITLIQWSEGDSMLFPPCDYVHINVEDAGALGMPESLNGIASYEEVIGALAPYLTGHETSIGVIPALKPGSGAPLGRIIGACRLEDAEPFYHNDISPDNLWAVESDIPDDEDGDGL